MGRLYIEYLDSRHVYTCTNCHTHLVDAENLISKVKLDFLMFKELSWKDRQGLLILERVSINQQTLNIGSMYIWDLNHRKQ